MSKGNHTLRRSLEMTKKQWLYRGRCKYTNPIDACWRCQPKWEKNRKRLADCALGFGRNTIGGKNGRIYVVTDASDNDMVNPKPGTLRHAVIQKEPLWIIFARSMIIELAQELIVTSDKTIDGRGAQVHIAKGAGITLQFVKNVIIHNLHIHDIVPRPGGIIRDSINHFGRRTESDGDGISVFGSSNIWIDHVSMSNCKDGLIDVVAGSTAITVSNCHMTHHNDVMLFGASDAFALDAKMQITVAFNNFGKGLVQRMPRCRWGYFHVVNNDYSHWYMYAIGGSQNPTIISQGNRFMANSNNSSKEVTKREHATYDQWKNWSWRSEGDHMLNGAFFVESGDRTASKRLPKQNAIAPQHGSLALKLVRYAGTIPCTPNKPC